MEQDSILMIGSESAPPASPEPPAAAEPAEQAEPPVESAPTPPPEPPAEPPVPPSVQARIDQMTRLRREAERERDFWKERAMTTAPAPQPPAPQLPATPPSEPQAADFETDSAYVAALHAYHARTALEAEQARQAAAGQEQAQMQAQAQLHAAIRAREADLVSQHPDYYERCESLLRQVNPAVKWALEQAGTHGPELVLYFSDHPDDVTRLNQTPPHRLGLELGQALSRLPGGTNPAREAPPPPTPKPEPPTAIAGGGRTTTPGFRDDMSQREWEEQWKRTFNRR